MNIPSLSDLLTGQPAVHDYYRNDESVQINRGDPCIFAMDGTRDGKDVHLPSSSSAAKASQFFAGIALEDIPVGGGGRVAIRGIVQKVNITLMTRAATTDGWASYPAIAVADSLIINTVGNGMSRSGAGAATIHPGYCVAMETVASATTQASTTSNTSLVSSTSIKCFLRGM